MNNYTNSNIIKIVWSNKNLLATMQNLNIIEKSASGVDLDTLVFSDIMFFDRDALTSSRCVFINLVTKKFISSTKDITINDLINDYPKDYDKIR